MNAIRDALAELVACRDLKDELDRFGGSHNAIDAHLERYQWLNAEYGRRKPLAWAAARAALAAPAQPVAWQHRGHSGQWSDLVFLYKPRAELNIETRPLYAAPPSQEMDK